MARLKVFVFDPIEAGMAPARQSPRSLKRQDAMLLQALRADLGALSGVEVVTAANLDAASGAAAAGHAGVAESELIGACIQAADAVWPLASESEGALERLSRLILHCKRLMLGRAPGEVEVAASKLKLTRVLADGSVLPAVAIPPEVMAVENALVALAGGE